MLCHQLDKYFFIINQIKIQKSDKKYKKHLPPVQDWTLWSWHLCTCTSSLTWLCFQINCDISFNLHLFATLQIKVLSKAIYMTPQVTMSSNSYIFRTHDSSDDTVVNTNDDYTNEFDSATEQTTATSRHVPTTTATQASPAAPVPRTSKAPTSPGANGRSESESDESFSVNVSGGCNCYGTARRWKNGSFYCANFS